MKGMSRKSRLLKVSSIALSAVLSSHAYAAGYRLEFQSPSVLADGGDAAVVEDAGTNWYNSAGLVYVPRQVAVSAIDLYEQTEFSGNTIAPSLIPGNSFIASGKASSYSNVGLPAIHYAFPIKDKYALGISFVPAWGLMQDYGSSSILRYDLIRIYTRTIDVAPSFSMKVNEQWSIGFGPDFSYFTLQQKNASRVVTIQDSKSRIVGSDWGFGAHAGILYRVNDSTRIGLNYRSKIAMNLTGYSSYIQSGVGKFETNRFNVNLPQPPTTTLSLYHDITPAWAMMGSIAYDQWSVIRGLNGHNYMLPGGKTTSIYLQQDYHNTFDFSVGTHYKLNTKWMLRGSIKYEQTPTNDSYRNVNFPDGEKLGFNFGARYQVSKKMALDLIYAHVFTRTVPINFIAPPSAGSVVASGHSSTTIDLAGAQIVLDI